LSHNKLRIVESHIERLVAPICLQQRGDNRNGRQRQAELEGNERAPPVHLTAP
jgi:hypothetical protein